MANASNIKPYRSREFKKLLKFTDDELKYQNKKLSAAYKFIDKFQAISNTFSFVIDFTSMQYLYVSESIEQVTGYSCQNWKEGGVEFAMSTYHPEDEQCARKIHERKFKHTFSLPIEERGQYKYTHDFRIRHAKGHYIRLNHHAIHLSFDDMGQPLTVLCICNDISGLKQSSTMQLEISKLDKHDCFTPVIKEYYPLTKAMDISSREYEVLTLLSQGETNKTIANKLEISEHTVRDHRRNMLKRNEVKTISELISLAWQHSLF